MFEPRQLFYPDSENDTTGVLAMCYAPHRFIVDVTFVIGHSKAAPVVSGVHCPPGMRLTDRPGSREDVASIFRESFWGNCPSSVVFYSPTHPRLFRTTEQRHKRPSLYAKFTIPAQSIIEKLVAATPNPMSKTTLNQNSDWKKIHLRAGRGGARMID